MKDTAHVIEGKTPGPHTVILGSMHGNERVGAEVVEYLADTLSRSEALIYGRITLILGNPQAYAENKRFTETDLNRQFGSGLAALRKNGSKNYEEKRALELLPFLEKADFLLDIHSTIKPSVPFVFTLAD